MSINPMWRSPVAVILTIAACVAGAPVQLEGDNIGLGQAVYSQPELAEALARTYEALEWQEENRENQDTTRNLDHIGGGNLLRDLGSARSRQVREEPSKDQKATTTRRPGLSHGFKDDPSKWSPNRGTLDSLGGSNFIGRMMAVERNLDHIGGGNLLRNAKSTENEPKTTRKPGLADGFKDDPSKWDAGRGTLDSLGGGNFVRREINNFQRNLDHIGGGNLLRNAKSTENEPKTTKKPGMAHGFKDDPSKWDAGRGTLDSLGGGNIVRREINNFQRNLDHIGGGNLLRNLRSPQNGFRTTLRPGLAEGFKDDPSKWSPNRGTLDPLGGGNLLRRSVNEEIRNLDRIGGGNLIRNLISFPDSVLDKTKPWEYSREDEYRTTLKPGLAEGFKDDPSKWSPIRGTLDSIGGGNLLSRRSVYSENENERNLDHIGGGNLLRDLEESRAEFRKNLDHIGGGNLLRDLEESRAEFRKNLDHIGGGNLLRDLEEVRDFERNLDHIGGGNLLRDLDNESK